MWVCMFWNSCDPEPDPRPGPLEWTAEVLTVQGSPAFLDILQLPQQAGEAARRRVIRVEVNRGAWLRLHE